MGTLSLCGAFAFGLVIGWITYRTVRRAKQNGLSDIATVIGAVGGATVTGLFRKETDAFGLYGVGLAVGFFLYLLVSLVVAKQTSTLSAVNEWLGEPQPSVNPGSGPLAGTKH
jgi:uncharacterized membrane protein YeaQ/YmgE (transglycosylase-associated protein family)